MDRFGRKINPGDIGVYDDEIYLITNSSKVALEGHKVFYHVARKRNAEKQWVERHMVGIDYDHTSKLKNASAFIILGPETIPQSVYDCVRKP